MTEEKKSMVPKLRFPGFNETWEQRKLEELASKFTGGGTPNTSNPNYWNGEIPWIQSSDLKEDDVLSLTVKKHISQEGLKNSATKIVPKNSLVIVTRVGVGKLVVNTQEIATSQDFLSLSGIKGDSRFLAYSLYSLLKKITRRVQGTSIKGITKTDFLKETILVPALEEQEKISSCMVEVDKLITLHQRKLEGLSKLKKSLLQKMFPKNGQQNPEVRFPGFTEAWEQRKLGELAATFGYGLNAAAKSFDGRHKYIRITDIDESTRRFLCSSLTSPDIDFEEAAPYRLAEGDVLFARTGASVGKSYRYVRTDGEVYFAGFLIRFRFKDKEAAEFVFQNSLTAKFQNFIKTSSQRSGQPGINAQQFSGYQIAVPNSEERERIGSFFSRLDTAITLHQRKLESLKKLKKSLLQQMFV